MCPGNFTTWQQLIPFGLQRFLGGGQVGPLSLMGELPGLCLVLSGEERVSVSTLPNGTNASLHGSRSASQHLHLRIRHLHL